MNSTFRNLVIMLAVIFITGCETNQPVSQPSKQAYEGIDEISTTTQKSRREVQYEQDEYVCRRLYKDDFDQFSECVERALDKSKMFAKGDEKIYKADLTYRKDARKAVAEQQKLEEKRIRANDRSAKEKPRIVQEWVKTIEKAVKVADKYF